MVDVSNHVRSRPHRAAILAKCDEIVVELKAKRSDRFERVLAQMVIDLEAEPLSDDQFTDMADEWKQKQREIW